MKKILILVYGLIFMNTAFGQVELEHTYFADNDGSILFKGLNDIGNNEYKYIFIETGIYGDSLILLYNLDHSLFQEIIIPDISNINHQVVTSGFYSGSANPYLGGLFLNRYIVNDDDYIEYGIFYGNNYSDKDFKIYNLNNELIKSISNCSNVSIIRSENNSSKLLISKKNLSERDYYEVYSLGGTIPTKTITINSKNENLKLYDAYPNPSDGTYTIKYELPKNVERAEIVFYSLSGVELKRYTVDRTFNTLIVDNSEFPKGTYIYKLITSDNISNSKKIIQK